MAPVASKPVAANNELDLKTKVAMIQRSESISQRRLAEEFKVSKSQVQRTLKRKAEVMMAYEENANSDKKCPCGTASQQRMNDIIWAWFQAVRARHIPISGPMIQAEALR